MEVLRTLVIGDIHGCLEEFEELLKKVQYNKVTDRLILVGDLIDRGPDSVGVVRKAREMDLECTMGNHEYKFLRWYKGTNHYSAYDHYTKFSDADVTYINNMPYFLKVKENLVIVHAGAKPGTPVERQHKDDLLYLRYTDKNRKFISIKAIAKQGPEALGAIFWTQFWHGPESIIYGHHVHSETDPLIEEVSPGVKCYGIDTGCCFGGRLTCLIVETGEIVQVQAKETYYKSFKQEAGE
jgi:hypothetical protein